MSAMDDIVAQGQARLSPATMASLRRMVDQVEPPGYIPSPPPLYGIRLIVDRDIPDGWLMPDRPASDGPSLPLASFVAQWRLLNGQAAAVGPGVGARVRAS